MTPLGRVVHALTFVLFGGAAAAAQSIHDLVVDQTDLPLPGVRLELMRDAQSQAVTVSGGDGRFELPSSSLTDIVQATLETRPHEATLLIDGFNMTDPVSGTTAVDLPLESVNGVAVRRNPVAAPSSVVCRAAGAAMRAALAYAPTHRFISCRTYARPSNANWRCTVRNCVRVTPDGLFGRTAAHPSGDGSADRFPSAKFE